MKLIKCPNCGKSFIENFSSIYKINYNYRTIKLCSYTCYTHFKELKQNKDFKEIDKLIELNS